MARSLAVAWREEALDSSGRKAAERLAAALPDGFYLAGGTALALRLGHRISLDLDLFSTKNRLKQAERAAILASLGSSGPFEILESKDGTCHLRVEKTSVSLFHYPYPMLKRPTPWRGLPVASLEDIAAMKLGAAIGRGSKKDFLDLHRLFERLGPEAVLAAGEKKFRAHSDFLLQAARALVYFEDAEKEPMPRLLKPISWEEVKAYFERGIPKLLRRRLSSRPLR